jgi:flavin reductase (DIM6/NTAB) family NADH-FMN oxidoreductase RutF
VTAQTPLDRVVQMLDGAMLVVTTVGPTGRSGCLVGFATQASIDPARFLVAISDKNHTCAVAAEAPRLAVHALDIRLKQLAALFGEQTGDEIDKFERCSWRPARGGVPVLTEAPAWLAGRIVERIPFGDHVGMLIEPDEGEVRDPAAQPLRLRDVLDLDPGHDA